MSFVLDVIQAILLHKAYDLTCAGAFLLLKKCSNGKNGKGTKWKSLKLLPSKQPSAAPKPPPNVPKPVIFEGRDLPRVNSGMIDPPRTSWMRICRNSYFS